MRRALLSLLIVICSVQAVFAQYDKDVFYYRGRTALSDGKYAQAIENFNILAQLDTSDYWTFFFRGIAKYNLGDLRGAQQDFNQSVVINPVFTNGYHYRAITLSRFGRYDEALADLQKAIELRPGLSGIYYSRGVTYFLAQQFENAVKDFDRYIRQEPRDPGAFLNRGASYLFLGDTLKAFDDYNKAISLDRFDAEGFIRRGRLYAEQGQYEEALSDMDAAIRLDSTSSLAHFSRALIYYEQNRYNEAVRDLDKVLEMEPGNALTLYNRSLINAQVGNFEQALSDMDRVININPNNVLAYYNRAAFFIQMERWQDALEDYDKAISLYPDFAKAYMNRSYVRGMLGQTSASKRDYDLAQDKIREYREKNESDESSFADTTKKYSSLIALDADFAKKDFDDELLQHRDIDIRLKPLYKFNLTESSDDTNYALEHRIEHSMIDRFRSSLPVPVEISSGQGTAQDLGSDFEEEMYRKLDDEEVLVSEVYFLKGLLELQNKQYNAALNWFDSAIQAAPTDAARDRYAEYYRAFYYMNRGVLRAEMIDFINSIQNNVQTLTMDDQGTTRARVSDQVSHTYDYTDALNDMQRAAQIVQDVPYIYFNMGNLHTLSSQMVEAIEDYGKAIQLYPYMGDAYFNRGLVLIYLKDQEKGCIDLSRAGELGVADAYSVIGKYCEQE
ncbi:MAG: tetratricopeptide repeat protein [Bacteroidales bacterium]|nr:tetratricopeptide repeat protein [Bacteroidales bacterium]